MTELVCSDCACAIDVCEFCGEQDCPRCVCYSCSTAALGQRIGDEDRHRRLEPATPMTPATPAREEGA